MKAYLDIETSFGGEITIIGIFCPPKRLTQLVGDEVNSTNLWNALDGVSEKPSSISPLSQRQGYYISIGY